MRSLKLFIVIIVTLVACKKNDSNNQLSDTKKPKANFEFVFKNPGSLPDTVNFSSTSTNAISYSWNFDDGNTSNIANPQIIYSIANTYNVKLIAVNQYGSDSITKQVIITLNPPKADFSFSILNDGELPCSVNFSNTSVGATSFQWHFGDGNTSANSNPQNTYSVNKTFSVKLVSSNSAGKDSVTKQVVINPILNSVLVYLITPKDNTFRQDYYTALKDCSLKLQDWYKTQMGNNKTFVLNPMIVDTLTGLHDSVWYNSYNGPYSGSDPRFYGYYNTYYEMQQLFGVNFNTTKYTYFIYVAAPGGGAGTTGFCAMGDQDLKGLTGQNPENLNPNRWIGGGGHELGHAFGLPHPDNQNWQALMWTGYLIYPDCILQQVDKDILNGSRFFK